MPRAYAETQRVTDILTQPVYAGYICSETYGIHWLKAQHEPLVSLETFQKVQDRRAGTAKVPKRANIGDKFALRGVVCCAGCDVPLRSSITRGNGGHYAYYLCQTKGCEYYGKSIKRDVLEADIGVVIKRLQPAPDMMAMAAAMFRTVWDTRRDQAVAAKRDAELEVRRLDKEIDKLVDLIMTSSNGTARKRFESKIAELEMNKALMAEKAAQHTGPQGSFEEKLEPALTFLANPWKLWQFGCNKVRREVAKLAFNDRLKYDRNQGARIPDLAFPFKALSVISDPEVCFGAGGGT